MRGLYGDTITTRLAMKVGRIAVEHTAGNFYCVGMDTRSSGQTLLSALTSSILGSGGSVLSAGVQPTPCLAYLTRDRRCAAGIVITASHNPKEYNGFKLFDGHGSPYTEEHQRKFEQLLSEERKAQAQSVPSGLVFTEGESSYVQILKKACPLKKPWRILIDPGGGSGWHVAPLTFRTSGCIVQTANAHPDGSFSARSPEPTENSLRQLVTQKARSGIDVAFAFDGDADRISAIDEKNKIVPGDTLLAAYASFMAGKGTRRVAIPVDTSMAVVESIESEGGHVITCKVGDANVSEAVRKENCVFGGEPSGAWIHPSAHFAPDGILSGLMILLALEESEITLCEFADQIQNFAIARGKMKVGRPLDDTALDSIEASLRTCLRNPSINRMDGVKAVSEKAWVLVRPSGTEPVVRIVAEAKKHREAMILYRRARNAILKVSRRQAS